MTIRIRPDKAAIEKEAQALKLVKPRVPEQSGFGDDNHEAIDAQVEVLERRLSYDDIYNRWGEDAAEEDQSEFLLNEAISARQWLDGQGNVESLAQGWDEIARPEDQHC